MRGQDTALMRNHESTEVWEQVWEFCLSHYEGIEKWQRYEVYAQARESGMDYEEALDHAQLMPEELLPEIVFEVVKKENPKYDES